MRNLGDGVGYKRAEVASIMTFRSAVGDSLKTPRPLEQILSAA
jgi:hypothetical protein